MNNYVIYTDASVNDKFRIGVCGYLCFLNEIELVHELILLENCHRSSDGENKSIYFALNYILENNDGDGGTIIVKTDQIHLAEYKKYSEKERLKQIFKIINKLEQLKFTVTIEYIKSRSGDKRHNSVDGSCRKLLKTYVNLLEMNPKPINILKRLSYKEFKKMTNEEIHESFKKKL